ncbi:vWA domain-containing protein [Pseudomonas batumici]|uniref:vWA domain-containing protein n=1 Tax=Pseudomonas batumici TaxID=226910 RepID=UPI0030D1A94F
MSRISDRQQTMGHQRGSVIILVTLSMSVLLSFIALSIDAGYVLYNQKRLQAATDAAALAGAADLWNSPFATAQTNAAAYSAGQGKNTLSSNVTVSPASITGLQLVNAQLPAAGAVSKFNGIQVVQQATVPLYFAKILGFASMQITATSKAVAGGGAVPTKYNVMILLDTTGSMNTTDTNCLGANNKPMTRLQCAQQAAITLINNLTNAGDNVGLMTYPPLATNTNFSCNSKQSIASSYSAVAQGVVTSGATYQVSGLSSGFLKNGQVNTTSSIAQALGAGGCSGIQAIGGLGTYFTQAIFSAQAALLSMSQSQSPPGQNVIVLMSDGDESSSQSQLGNTYKSQYGSECKTSVTAANTVKQTGTQIYSVAYIGGGSTSAPCSDGSSDLTPCNTMQQIATGPSYFFSDTCPNAAGGSVNLNTAFKTISYALTKPRLIPPNAM